MQQELEKAFTYKCRGPLTEYVGIKITIHCDGSGLQTVEFTEPVLIHKLWEEYGPMDGPASWLPAVTGIVIVKRDGEETMSDAKAKMYWLAVATCIMRSCHDIYNVVCGLARHIIATTEAFVQALMTLMTYVVFTENRGVVIAKEKWSVGD